MSSINNGYNFIYANESSDEYGVFLCSSVGSTSRSASVENRTIVASKNSGSNNTFGFHGIKVDEPLTFDIIIANIDGTYIDTYKERILKKWLLKSSLNWLQIDQDDMAQTLYYVIAKSCEIIDVGTYSGAMKITFQADSNSAWTNQNTKTYATSGGTLNFKMNIDTDYDDELVFPIATITATSNGNITINNATRNETITIAGCVNGEVIVLDSSSGKVSTTAPRVLSNYWNKRYLRLQDGTNNLLLTGNFTLKLQYRQMVRIGG